MTQPLGTPMSATTSATPGTPAPGPTSPTGPTASPVPLARHPHRWPAFLSITPTPPLPLLDRPGAWLRALLRHAWLPLVLACLFNALTYLAAGLVPTVLGAVVDHGLAGSPANSTPYLLFGLVALALLGVASGLGGSLAEYVSTGTWASGWQPSGRGVAHRLGRHPRAVTRAVHRGDVVSTVDSDAEAIGELFYFLANVAGSLVSMVVVGVLMIRMDVGLGLLVLLALPIVLALVGVLLRPLDRRMSVQREE